MLNKSRKLKTEIKKERLYLKDRGEKTDRKELLKLDWLVYSHVFPCYQQGLHTGSFEGIRVFPQPKCPYVASLIVNGGMQHLCIAGVIKHFHPPVR